MAIDSDSDKANRVATTGDNVSPLNRARQIVAGMARSEKDAYWLGLRMENFLLSHEHRIDSVTVGDVCDYLEGLMRKGQPDWQVKQSLDAIGLLLKHGYLRSDLGVPQLRAAWGVRLNERVGISDADPTAGSEGRAVAVVDRIRRVLRVAHYAMKTEKANTQWWERFEKFANGRSSDELGPDDVRAFLEHLAVERSVSAATQKQALNALVFVFGQVLGRPLGNLGDWTLAKASRSLPCVFTADEAKVVLSHLRGVPALVAQLLYGSGLRLMEALRLRFKDVDFESGRILVRDGKGEKDRVTLLPQSVHQPLLEHLRGVWRLHQRDLSVGGRQRPTAVRSGREVSEC